MSIAFSPRLDVLPVAQRRLWPELAETPARFTLYGGTAIALRLGHRQSVDFDFFASTSFEPAALLEDVPYLKGAVLRQSAANTLTATVDRGGSVQLSFFGGLGLGQVAPAEIVAGPGFKVAALIDLAGMKAAVVTQRAELRDYLDIHARCRRCLDATSRADRFLGPTLGPEPRASGRGRGAAGPRPTIAARCPHGCRDQSAAHRSLSAQHAAGLSRSRRDEAGGVRVLRAQAAGPARVPACG